MRILVVDPGIDFSVGDVFRGLCKGLNNTGNTVASFSTADRIRLLAAAKIHQDDGVVRDALDTPGIMNMTNQMMRGALYDTAPDLTVIVSGFFVTDLTLQLMRARKSKVVAVMTEQPYELSRELWLASMVDGVALNDPTHIDKFREVCPNVWYQPHAYDPDLHYRGDGRHDYDAWWCGTGYDSRCDWLESAVTDPRWPTDARVALGGNWKPLATRPDSPLHRYLLTRRIERGAGSAYRVDGRDVRQKDVALLFADAATGLADDHTELGLGRHAFRLS